MSNAIILNHFNYYANEKLTEKDYTFTGKHEYIRDTNGDWRIKLLSSGVFKPLVDTAIDVFLVGGGGAGKGGSGTGGGGGYTVTYNNIEISEGSEYQIQIGAGGGYQSNGGNTSAFNKMVAGGIAGINGGSSGSGGGLGGTYIDGCGGSDGSDGFGGGGKGQHATTREFNEPFAKLYSGGGGGDQPIHDYWRKGGAGGGGKGSDGWNKHAEHGKVNSGGGGGASSASGGYQSCGGSGIVVIRNSERFDMNSLINDNIIIETNIENQSKFIARHFMDSSITFKEDRVEARYGNQGSRELIATPPIDLTTFSKIRMYGKFVGEPTGLGGSLYLFAACFGIIKPEIIDDIIDYNPNVAFVVSKRINGLNGYLEIDISNISGVYNVGAYGYSGWDTYKIEVLK